jgi:4-oxalocrotonate tautomerase
LEVAQGENPAPFELKQLCKLCTAYFALPTRLVGVRSPEGTEVSIRLGGIVPFIQVSMFEGSSPEDKRLLARRLTDVVQSTLNVSIEAISVVIYEVPPEDWAVAGKSLG